MSVNFQPDPADLVLSSIPGGALFNPRKHRFTEEELKPQPMIKKAKKVFVPEDAKVRLYVFPATRVRLPKHVLNGAVPAGQGRGAQLARRTSSLELLATSAPHSPN